MILVQANTKRCTKRAVCYPPSRSNWRKQSVLLTNSPHPHVQERQVHHTQITRRAGVETDEVTPFPPLLCQRIAKAVMADVMQRMHNSKNIAHTKKQNGDRPIR